jgi:hypothetical protein
MELVKVDVIGLQAPQRVLAGFEDVVAAGARIVRQIAHTPIDFGCQHHLIAQIAILQKFSDNALAFSLVIDIGGIEKINASLHGFLHDRERIGFTRRPPEVHRSQT